MAKGDTMRRALTWACVLVLVFNVPYCVSLLPAVRPVDGYVAFFDLWLNGLADAAILVAVLIRARLDRQSKAGWLCVGAALTCAFMASMLWYAHYRHLPTRTGVTLSDIGWLAFYVLLFVGTLLLLRTRVRRMWAGMWWDGAVAALTAAAVAVAYIPQADPGAALSNVGFAGFYSISDLGLVALGAAALAMLGRARDLTWWLMCAAFVIFAATDWIYAEQLARGDYVVGGPLELGWQLPRLALLGAALTSLRLKQRPVTLDGVRMLAVPAACASPCSRCCSMPRGCPCRRSPRCSHWRPGSPW